MKLSEQKNFYEKTKSKRCQIEKIESHLNKSNIVYGDYQDDEVPCQRVALSPRALPPSLVRPCTYGRPVLDLSMT